MTEQKLLEHALRVMSTSVCTISNHTVGPVDMKKVGCVPERFAQLKKEEKWPLRPLRYKQLLQIGVHPSYQSGVYKDTSRVRDDLNTQLDNLPIHSYKGFRFSISWSSLMFTPKNMVSK